MFLDQNITTIYDNTFNQFFVGFIKFISIRTILNDILLKNREEDSARNYSESKVYQASNVER